METKTAGARSNQIELAEAFLERIILSLDIPNLLVPSSIGTDNLIRWSFQCLDPPNNTPARRTAGPSMEQITPHMLQLSLFHMLVPSTFINHNDILGVGIHLEDRNPSQPLHNFPA